MYIKSMAHFCDQSNAFSSMAQSDSLKIRPCTTVVFETSAPHNHVFATCSNGIFYDNRSCPADLVWDDDLKRCSTSSKTCPESRKLMDLLKDKRNNPN